MKRSLKGEMMNECYISVDVETTGPSPAQYQMVEIGACVVGDEGKSFESIMTYFLRDRYLPPSTEVLNILGFGSEFELGMRTGSGINYLPTRVMPRFAKWVSRVAGNAKPIFVANNAPFDWMFVCSYFDRWEAENPFGHSALDMKAYSMGITGCTWKEATLKTMAKRVAATFEKLPHRALEDAIIQGRIFNKLLECRKETK